MHYYYITGTSRGIGKALAETLLQTPTSYVIGISRTQSIQHERYEHLQTDLSNLSAIQQLQFIPLPDATSITLVNNSGVLGQTKHVGKLPANDIATTFTVNSIAPSILMNAFIAAYQNDEKTKTILNISSGAGRHTIEAWSSYCASKAALDMFSEVANQEQQTFQQHPIRVFSVAPGIVDTSMQTEIRQTSSADFSEVQRFVDYKKNGELSDPSHTATLLLKVLKAPENYSEVKLDVRKL